MKSRGIGLCLVVSLGMLPGLALMPARALAQGQLGAGTQIQATTPGKTD